LAIPYWLLFERSFVNHSLILEQPAGRWEDVLPVGGGLTGAAIYGSIHQETILLNRQDVWLPLWERPTVPDMAGHLPRYRQLLEAGRFEQADRFWRQKLKEQGWPDCFYTNPFCAGFDLRLEQQVHGAFERYCRRLDMDRGVASVEWDCAGQKFARELFVSRADDLVVLRVTGPGGMIGIKAAFDQHSFMEDNRKQNHYAREYKPEEIPLKVTTRAQGCWLVLDGRFEEMLARCTHDTRAGGPRHTRAGRPRHIGGGFGCVARIIAKGSSATIEPATVCWHDGPVVSVQNADEVLIVARVFKGPATPKAVREAKSAVGRAEESYDALLRRHLAEHRKLYRRVELEIADKTDADTPNDILLADAYQNRVSNSLTERMFNYGRYLFISSTHSAGRPPNLQGIWNGDYLPAWSSDYTLDENVQMMHWAAMPGNLPELMEPYFRLFESTIKDWQTNARRFFGCRGIYAPLRQSDHGLLPVMMPYLIWFAGAGWLAQPFHDYFLFTGDRKFLRDRAVPFLKQVALFYEDFLYEGKDGRLTICPSMSPENKPDVPGATTISINPTMDVAVCREVLGNLCSACELLGIERAGVRRWREILAKLPEYAVNEDGALKEWLRPELKDNYHHRHQSHIYPLFPGSEVTRESNPRLFEACRVAVEKRLVIGIKSQTGWSLAHMANIYARLEDGDKALECLDLLARACTGANLWTYHNDWRKQGITMDAGKLPPFQMDANLGLTAAVLEMLAFSACSSAVRRSAKYPCSEVFIKLLPALPARWKRGSVKGLLCRGGVELAIEWDRPARKLQVALRSKLSRKLTIKVPTWANGIAGSGSRIGTDPRGKDYITLFLPAGKSVRLTNRD
jgi:alpha-L-fucosidase 2